MPAVGWRFNGTVALASQSGGRPAVCLYAVLFTVLWVLFWILVLMPAAERLMAATTTLTHVRMTLPRLMLLAFTVSVISLTGHVCMVRALRLGEASVLATYEFTQLLATVAIAAAVAGSNGGASRMTMS